MMILKSPWEIDLMRKSSRIVAETLEKLVRLIEPGVTTLELDRFAETYISRRGGKPAFKGYRGYPYTLCASVNEQVVHAFPSARRLKEGDIVSLDLGVVVDGYYGDAAITVPVGKVSEGARRLIAATQKALTRAILAARPGNYLSDISHAVQSAVEAQGFSVVRLFVGHGIGRSLHEEPQIPNFGPPAQGPILKPGLVLAIEPMANAGGPDVTILDDCWTAVTCDRSLSAHFEHTVALTENGVEVLTSFTEDEMPEVADR
ncbi:type I methionyl aminopeptidase [Candidatus Methylomirabilis sp.]|uniref:Methionine aminopeptidase n=1 Tax=Candidatus Methylomirabilis tolerans TaxID=3123416 RepID=A0AAJ1AKX5_9BACT|nr:type I methionyl aminopeptidase [Candidatus Methylomirabilis sp.]